MKIFVHKTIPGIAAIAADPNMVCPADYVIIELSNSQETQYNTGAAWWTPSADDPYKGSLSFKPVFIPTEIENWKARAVLEIHGILDDVENIIQNAQGEHGIILRHAWDGRAPLYRNSISVQTIATALNLSDAEIDAMFVEASQLNI